MTCNMQTTATTPMSIRRGRVRRRQAAQWATPPRPFLAAEGSGVVCFCARLAAEEQGACSFWLCARDTAKSAMCDAIIDNI